MGKKADNPLPASDSDTTLANEFANYFIDKVEAIRNDLINHPPYSPTTKDTPKLSTFEPLNQDSISKLIKSSKATTCLLDPIPTKLLKENAKIISPAITKISNTSLTAGSFFEEWKTAVVTPLLKKRDLDTIKSNY